MTADVLLLYPPASQCRSPHLALPLLQAFLHSRDVGCDIRDLNLDCFRYFIRLARLQTAVERIQARLQTYRAHDHRSESNARFVEHAELALLHWEFVHRKLVPSLETLSDRGPKLPSDVALREANTAIRYAYQILSTEFHPVRWEEEVFAGGFDPSRCCEVLDAAGPRNTNPFHEFCGTIGLAETLDLAARRFVGISICFQSQFVSGLTLARYIRETMGPDFPIVLGGPVAMYMRRNPAAIGALFDVVSGVVYGEGETPLLEILRVLERGGSLSEVPAMIYRDTDKVRLTPPAPSPPLSSLPRPTFDQLPLDDYLCNRLELPVFSERGCYYGECTFCCVDLSPDRRFVSRRVELMVEDIEYYQRAHQATLALLITTALPAPKAAKLSDQLLKRAVTVGWGTNVRYEDRFTDEILLRMREAGCLVLNVGLESGSERIVTAMKKGFSIAQATSFHERAARAGVRVGLYIMLGFPGETHEDRVKTAQLLVELGMRMEDLSIGQFVLHEFAPMFNNPEDYGIEILTSSDQLSISRSYRYTDGRPMPDDLVAPFKEMLSRMLGEADRKSALQTQKRIRPGLKVVRASDYLVRRTLARPARYLILSEHDGSTFEVEDPTYAAALLLADGKNTVRAIAGACEQPLEKVTSVVAELIENGLLTTASPDCVS